MSWYLFSGRSRVVKIAAFTFASPMFFDILKVGAVACFSPLQSVLTISIFTNMLARFGTEILAGYGIGSRLEFMLIPIAFAVGIASVPMVGMASARAHRPRPRRLDRGARALSVGAFANFIAIFPDIWVNLFTDDPACAPPAAISVYGGACMLSSAFDDLYFASQGAGKMIGPVLAQTARLLFIAPAAGGCRRTMRPHRFLQAGGRLHGIARRALMRQRDADPLGTEAAPCRS